MSDDLKFKLPFSCIVSGPSGSGKSSFCIQFQQNLKALRAERNFDGGEMWCYNERTAVPKQLPKWKKKIRFHEGVPSDFNKAHGKSCLVILDDLSNDVYSKKVCDLCSKCSNHRKSSSIKNV